MIYSVVTWLVETTTGGAVYIARRSECPGCFAQGGTPDEARAALEQGCRVYSVGAGEIGLSCDRLCGTARC